MSIERLSFDSKNDYSAIELAVHLTRYLTAQKLCAGLKVLDVACGEGYGSYAMATFWNAESVTGVDISEESIAQAQNIFSHPKIEYIAAAAEKIEELFEHNSFDMIVSLETIEHLEKPERFLAAIKKVLKPNGIIILSCPNDHWYYGPGDSENPFHLKTYYFDEFKDLAEKHLGQANCYLLGRPITGFGNFLWSATDSLGSEMTMTDELIKSRMVPATQVNSDEPVLTDDCSFFVGIWGDLPFAKDELISCTFYSTSMDKFSLSLEDDVKLLTAQINALTANLENSEKSNKELQSSSNTDQNRIADLEKWTVELQSVINNSQTRILDLEKWTVELQNFIADLEKQTENFQLELLETNKKTAIVQMESERFVKELETAKNTIAKMEESKFWKIRNQWFNLKDGLPLNEKDK